MYTAFLHVIIYQLAKYEKDPMKNGREIAERKEKEKTRQQQKGIPTLSADLYKYGRFVNSFINPDSY